MGPLPKEALEVTKFMVPNVSKV
uniref:Uncharacterized protein n=1 Tax=Arundo donax TaxID=35708 RepID=A0A0A8ZP61_ARUDO